MDNTTLREVFDGLVELGESGIDLGTVTVRADRVLNWDDEFEQGQEIWHATGMDCSVRDRARAVTARDQDIGLDTLISRFSEVCARCVQAGSFHSERPRVPLAGIINSSRHIFVTLGELEAAFEAEEIDVFTVAEAIVALRRAVKNPSAGRHDPGMLLEIDPSFRERFTEAARDRLDAVSAQVRALESPQRRDPLLRACAEVAVISPMQSLPRGVEPALSAFSAECERQAEAQRQLLLTDPTWLTLVRRASTVGSLSNCYGDLTTAVSELASAVFTRGGVLTAPLSVVTALRLQDDDCAGVVAHESEPSTEMRDNLAALYDPRSEAYADLAVAVAAAEAL